MCEAPRRRSKVRLDGGERRSSLTDALLAASELPMRRRSSRLGLPEISESARPGSPLKPCLSLTSQELNLKREVFEGHEEYSALRKRLQKKVTSRTKNQSEFECFISLMQARGGGKVAIAWRRYFDSDGDGSLNFTEFCHCLADLGFKGDVPQLWADLGVDESEELSLEAIDPENWAILDFFSSWCRDFHGGPVEAFRALDGDGSDSLECDELVEGLAELGFLDLPNLPDNLSNEAMLSENLYPLLDQSGKGAISPDQLLFLEQDKDKRVRLQRQLARIRDHGIQGAPEPLRNDAQRLLHKLAMNTTLLGGKHWKQLDSKHVQLAVGLPTNPLRFLTPSRTSLASLSPKRLNKSTSIPQSVPAAPALKLTMPFDERKGIESTKNSSTDCPSPVSPATKKLLAFSRSDARLGSVALPPLGPPVAWPDSAFSEQSSSNKNRKSVRHVNDIM